MFNNSNLKISSYFNTSSPLSNKQSLIKLINFEKSIPNDYKIKYKNTLNNCIKKFKLTNKKINEGGNIIGKGYNAIAYKFTYNGNMFVIKLILKTNNTIYSLFIEYLITNLLNDYDIPTGEIVYFDKLFRFLIKKYYDSSNFGNKIETLTQPMKDNLFDFFKKTIIFTIQTDIGLNTKSDNLVWDGNIWKLVDTGPRVNYLPYCFTIDLLPINKRKLSELNDTIYKIAFSKYLDVWHTQKVQGKNILI